MSIPQLTKTVHRTLYPSIDPSNPRLSTAGKTVIISGGAGGIGYLIAKAFSVAGAARIVMIARRQEALDEGSTRLQSENAAAGRTTDIWTYLLDIRNSSAAEQVFSSIRTRLNEGRGNGEERIDADILITSAAQFAPNKLTLEFEPQEWRDVFETNAVGNMNLVRAFLAPEIPSIPFTSVEGWTKDVSSAPAIKHEKIIIDVSSSNAYHGFPGGAAYATSKLAFTRMMMALNDEVNIIDKKPIRVHYYSPGAIFTPGTAKYVDKEAVKFFPWDDESLPGSFAVWLASPEAEFLRGRFVMSSWDVEELKQLKPKYEANPKFGTITLIQ